GFSGVSVSRNAHEEALSNRERISAIGWYVCRITRGRKTYVKDHLASLRSLALLGKGTARPGSQRHHVELRRHSHLDAAPQAHADDRRLSKNPDSPDRSRILLRHPAHHSNHREIGSVRRALSKRAGSDDEGLRLVDREGLFLQRRVPDDRQHARDSPGADRRATPVVSRQPRSR